MFGIRKRASKYYNHVKELPGKATQQVEETMELAKLLTIKFFMAMLTCMTLMCIAVFMYGMFYFTFVPVPEHQGQIFLTFQPCEETPGRCGFLNGSLHLPKHNHILMAGQPYTVSLILEMPESPTNRNSGMFMACAQLKSKSSNIVRHNCKSAMLQYRSELLRKIDTFVFLPGLLTGHLAEKQKVEIEIFDDFHDDPLNPALQLDVQIQSRFVEIYSADYQIHANFGGLRYMMFHYPLTSAFIGSSLNMLLLSVIFILSWYRFFLSPDEEVSSESGSKFVDPFSTTETDDEETLRKEALNEPDLTGKPEPELTGKSDPDKSEMKPLDEFLDGEEEKAFVILKKLTPTVEKEE